MSTTPAGWYRDPNGAGLRWWDGVQWTQHVHLPQPQPVYVTSLGNGIAVAALVCGLVGVLFSIIPLMFVIGMPLGLLAVVFGAVGFRRTSVNPMIPHRGMAVWGIILGLIAFGIGVYIIAAIDAALS
jgi:hypothetical protein